MKEYVIWGIPPNKSEETILATKYKGQNITDSAYANFLEDKTL
jgi:hypothetical protein